MGYIKIANTYNLENKLFYKFSKNDNSEIINNCIK